MIFGEKINSAFLHYSTAWALLFAALAIPEPIGNLTKYAIFLINPLTVWVFRKSFEKEITTNFLTEGIIAMFTLTTWMIAILPGLQFLKKYGKEAFIFEKPE